MRIDRVFIDGFRNLRAVEVDFHEGCLTSVVIGENGSGKSNLIEAIVQIFRQVDVPSGSVKFTFEIDYVIRYHKVRIHNREGTTLFVVDGEPMSSRQFNLNKESLFPDLVFGYYSGTSRRLEKLFDDHQARYYGVINQDRDVSAYERARSARRLFYCRPIHGVFALLAHFAKPGRKKDVSELLSEKLGITGFHSALAHFKEPSWFNHSNWKRQLSSTVPSSRGRRPYEELEEQARDLWGAKGPAGDCARALQSLAFYPLAVTGKVVDDYRSKAKTEAQLACFLRDQKALARFAQPFGDDQDLFAALEAADISDLFREILVWVTRKDDESGDIGFSDLSDGERQLLMVLGLIRVSRGKEALFLLDEPDTHLNPAWQLSYLDLIQEWTEVAADEDKCQIIMTTHNPLTIAALTKKEVRVMQTADDGQIKVAEPYADPRGLGFTSTLTEIFGLPTTLDPETQKQIDERNTLARIEERSEKQERMLIELNDKLDRLGFLHESRDPLYDDFLKAVHDYKYADRPPMTQEQIEKRRRAMQALVQSLSEQPERPH
ncbi:AAA family ATPase [Pseudaminobacter soli (ex Li et al. 2025)]|uniref:AAA family ATPase n=1 Tax=Pseudaminobacter soli (ex Li et al. 2025) TaxID=1295366 RepID=A0A2P7S0H7_9HYPH|nr:AAA family ATPase [Mesorhizobium soli]PSJ55943.1 AAA family ATPase [Mesorhizobium soli]